MPCQCNDLVLTPQEQWMEAGILTNVEESRQRTFKRLDAIRKAPIYLCVDRARLFTEGMKMNERKPLELRWALALKHIAENIPLYIGPDDLIVGRGESKPGRCGMLYPEIDGAYLDTVGRDMCDRPDAPYYFTEADYEVMVNEIAPYWKDKSWPEHYAMTLPEETRRIIFGENKDNFYRQQNMVFASGNTRSSQNWVQDYDKVLKMGLKGLREKAQNRLEELKETPVLYAEHSSFLEACVVTCDAIAIWVQRYVELAKEMAAKEENPSRKAELEEIIEICSWVPENPARTFKEAMQSHWFIYMFTRIEQLVGASLSLGRLDQMFYPYYKKDLEEGRITRDEAKALFESLWVNMSEAMSILVSPAGGAFSEGYAHFEGVTLGGQTREGEDATNELSYVILDSKKGIPINYPDLAVRIHNRTPDKFLKAVTEIIKDGQGYPKLFNDEEIIPLYLGKGISMEDALDYVICSCAEYRVLNKETYIHAAGTLNIGAMIEMVLHNGRCPEFGNIQYGLETGDPRDFKTFDEFYEAYKKQHLYFLDHVLIQQTTLDIVKPKFLAAPLTSMLHDKCFEQCKDINDYVDPGEDGLREKFCDMTGFGTGVDSLAAIKKLVYDEKRITMDELITALDANFEGYEAIRQMCLNAPKYGNNDPYADEIGKDMDAMHLGYLAKQKPYMEREIISMRMVPVTIHIFIGKVTNATPNGRKAGQPLSEGASASHGCDTHGPTSNLLSQASTKNVRFRNRHTRLLNMKLSPATVAGEEGTKKLMQLIRTWCDLKLYHVQFNIINRETLLAAQEDTEKYRNLVVRVAGYSAYFVELSHDLQDEIIARTEHTA